MMTNMATIHDRAVRRNEMRRNEMRRTVLYMLCTLDLLGLKPSHITLSKKIISYTGKYGII